MQNREMPPEKKQRAATAIVFLFGVLAAMNALRDASVLWPPDVVWAALTPPKRFQFVAGLLLVVGALVSAAIRRRGTPNR
jgi:hypothetical protein